MRSAILYIFWWCWKQVYFLLFFNTCILYQTTGIFRRDLKTQGQRIYNIWENICWKESQLLKEYTKRTVMISAIRIHWPSFSFDCNFRLTVFAVYRRHIAEGRIRKLRYSYFSKPLALGSGFFLYFSVQKYRSFRLPERAVFLLFVVASGKVEVFF